MKKVITAIITVFMMICILPVPASAEKILKAPTVQYKLINHDELALRWTEVEGANEYYIYRTDVETGKTVRYKNTVKGTTVEVKGLTAESEYIFQVAAVSESNGQTVIGRKSKGTKLTTPKEWYCRYSYTVIKNKIYDTWVYDYYKENYSKTKREKIILESLDSVRDFFCYDEWIYFISRAPRDYYGGTPSLYSKYCVGRIKEDGTDEEILLDGFWQPGGYGYSYKVHDDYIYVYRDYSYYCYYGYYGDVNEEDELFTFRSDYCRVSLKTGEASKICDIYTSDGGFDIYGDYIYFMYSPQEYNEEVKGYAYCEDENIYLCRVKTDGTGGKEILYKLPDNIKNVSVGMYIYEDKVYFLREDYQKSIIKIPLSGGDPITICEHTPYIDDFEIVNGYVYFTEYKNYSDLYNKSNPKAYCRIKIDGTGLTKRSTPFEWRY